MGLKFEPKVASLDNIPEPFRTFYTPAAEGEGFEMPSEIFQHLDNTQLSTALDKERKAHSAKNAALKAWEPLGNPEETQAKLKELSEALASKSTDSTQFDKFKAEVQAANAKVIAEKDAEVTRMKATVEGHLIDSEANRALFELKGSSALLLPVIKASAKVVEDNGKYVVRVLDTEGDPRYTTNGAFMTINDLVAEMKVHPEYGKAFESSGTSGSGMRPGSGTPPVKALNPGTMSSAQKIEAGLLKQQQHH